MSKKEKAAAETKRQAVEDYLSGQGSQLEICRRYNIQSKHPLQNLNRSAKQIHTLPFSLLSVFVSAFVVFSMYHFFAARRKKKPKKPDADRHGASRLLSSRSRRSPWRAVSCSRPNISPSLRPLAA